MPTIDEHAANDPLIYKGATQADLCAIFGMQNADVKNKISAIRPSGQRNGRSVWHLRDVAPVLVKPNANIVERVLRMHPNELPKMLSKEYWIGQNHRLTYLQRTGELWSTKAVVDLAGQAFKTLRLSMVLFADAVERENGLAPAQREILARLIATALEEMRENLVEKLTEARKDSEGKSFAPEAEDEGGDL